MTLVKVDPNLPPPVAVTKALRVLKRKLDIEGLGRDLRRHRAAMSPGAKKRAKRLRAANMRRLRAKRDRARLTDNVTRRDRP